MASKKIKGITIEIGSDVTQLDKGLKQADKSIKQVKEELGEVERALKLSPGNTDLIAQKQKLLAEQVEKTKEKLKFLKDAEIQVENQFKNGQISAEQYRAFQREVSNTEAQLRKLEVTTDDSSGKLKSFASGSLSLLKTGFVAVTETVKAGVSAFKAYVTGIVSVTTAASGFAIKSGASFEESMSNVEAISGATGESLKALEDKAKEMGANTSKSAKEAADALGFMALAGWDNAQMLAGLEPILRASEAGHMDLARCSDLVTDSMSAMGIKTEELNSYLDKVTKTQNSSNTSMQQLLEAYVACGGTMKNMNISVDESATLLGTLANRGKKGSEAGNALNSILVNLMGASGKASKALDELNISMYNADGSRKTVTETLKELNTVLAECTEEQKDAFTANIGGKTQMDTLQALLSGVSEEYSDLNEKIKSSDGALLDTAKTMQDNFNGSITAAKSAAEGLGISLFDTFSEGLTERIRDLTEYISRLARAIKNGSILGAIKNISNEISKTVSEMASDLGDKIRAGTGIFNQIILSISDFLIEFIPVLTDQILPALLSGFFELVNGLAARIPELLPALIKLALEFIKNFALGLIDSGLIIITTIAQSISDNLSELIASAIEIIVLILNTIIDNLDVLFEAALQIIYAICDALLDNLDPLIDAAVDLIVAIVIGLIDNLDKLIEAAIKIIVTLGTALLDAVPELLTATDQIIDKLADKFKSYDWKGLGKRILEGILDGLIQAGEKVKEVAGRVGGKIAGIFGADNDVPAYANGGVVTSGTALVGEAGPELLTVASGRTVITPLARSAEQGTTIGGKTAQFNNVINIGNVYNNADIENIANELAYNQMNALTAIGGW